MRSTTVVSFTNFLSVVGGKPVVCQQSEQQRVQDTALKGAEGDDMVF